MLFRGTDERVAELAGRLTMPDLIERTMRAILDELPVYRDEVHVTRDELRTSVVRNLDVAVRTLRSGTPPDFTQAGATGRARAQQGAPLPALIRAYRIGLTEVWRAVVEQLHDGRPGDLPALVRATTAIWDLADDYAETLTTAYRGASAELLVAHQAERSALAEALFAGGAATEGKLWDVARVLGLPVDGDFVAVVAENAALGREPLAGIEAGLRAVNHASVWRLTPDTQAGVIPLRPGGLAPVLALLADRPLARVGVSPVYSGLAHTARALHLARVALATLPAGRGGIAEFGDSPLAGLVASAPEESAQLARQVLAPLLDLPDEDQRVLLATLRAWFACSGSTNRTAEQLYCHPNTVRLRLRRIVEELGRPLGDPEHVAELGAALRALAIFPGAEQLLPGPRVVAGHNLGALDRDGVTDLPAQRAWGPSAP